MHQVIDKAESETRFLARAAERGFVVCSSVASPPARGHNYKTERKPKMIQFPLFAETVFMLILIAASLAFPCGCSSTPTGVNVVASSATATTVGDINWDEFKIPVFSIYTGPKTKIWINRDYLALKKVTAEGTVTNNTFALGFYSSKEQKRTCIEMEFSPVSTNTTHAASVGDK